MEIDNLITKSIVDPDGTVFELTDDMQKWGYVLKRNGGVDKKWNQAMVIFTGRDGKTYSQDNNGSTFVWNNKQWNYVIKDNKTESAQFLKSETGSPAKTLQTAVAPKSIATNLGVKIAPLTTPVVKSATQAVNEMLAKDELPPPESTLAAPLSANGPVYMQEMLQTPAQQTATPTATASGASLKAGFMSNPLIMAAMVAAVVLMVVIARRKKSSN